MTATNSGASTNSSSTNSSSSGGNSSSSNSDPISPPTNLPNVNNTTTTPTAPLDATTAASARASKRTINLLHIRLRDTTRTIAAMQRERDAAAAQIDSLRKRKRQLDHDLGPATRKKKALEQELEEARTDAAVAKVVGVFLEWGDPLGLLGMVVGRFGGRLVLPAAGEKGGREVVAGGEGEGAGAGGGDGGGEGGAEGGVGDRGGRLPVVGEETPKQGFDRLLSPPGAQSVAVEKAAAVKMEEVEGAEGIKREEQQDGGGSGSGRVVLEFDSWVEMRETLDHGEALGRLLSKH